MNNLMKIITMLFFIIITSNIVNSQTNNVDILKARILITSPSYTNSRVITVQDSILNCDSTNIFIKTLSSNVKFSFTSLSNNKWITFLVTNDSTGYLTQWNDVKWPNGIVPAQSSGLGIYRIMDIYSFIKINNQIYGSVIQGYR